MTEREELIDLLTDVLGDSIARKADYLISNGVTIQKWIPVWERLPEDGSVVLAYHNHSGDKRVCLEIYNEGAWFDLLIRMWDEGVTHWMPLPAPPKEET